MSHGATASYSSSGTYTDPITGMTATVGMNDYTTDSIGLSDSDTEGASFASGSETPSSESLGETESMSDAGSDTASYSASGTLASGVTYSVTSGDTDGFSDTDHEQDTDNAGTDSESAGGTGGDACTETDHMSEGGSITDSSEGLEGVYVPDSFSGLTGSFSLTDDSTDGFGDSGSGSDSDTGADTASEADWSAALSGGDTGTDDANGSETVTYNASAASAHSSFSDYEHDISTFSDYDAGSNATSAGSTTSQDTLTATDGGSAVNTYSSSVTTTGTYLSTGTFSDTTLIDQSDSDAYSDTNIDAETINAAGTATPTSSDDTQLDNGAYSFSLYSTGTSTATSESVSQTDNEESDGLYDDSHETVNGTVYFISDDSGESDQEGYSLDYRATASYPIPAGTTEITATTQDNFTYHAAGTTTPGGTGYSTVNYYDDSYHYVDTTYPQVEDPIWESTEIVTTTTGGGSDYHTTVTNYTDGSALTGGGGGGGGADFFGGGGRFHTDLYDAGGGTVSTSNAESTSPGSTVTEHGDDEGFPYRHWYNPFSWPAMAYEGIALPVVNVIDWNENRKINAKWAELEEKKYSRGQADPTANRNVPGQIPSYYNQQNAAFPGADRKWNEAAGPIKVLANVGMTWDAAAGSWVSPSGAKFAFKGGKWSDARTGRSATAAELKSIEQARNAGQKIGAKTWQEYENGAGIVWRGRVESCKYTAVVNGKRVNGVADNVTIIGGKRVAIEAKFVDKWGTSLRNPASTIGKEPFAIEEQTAMLEQAKKYSAVFQETIYHTNSPELIGALHQELSVTTTWTTWTCRAFAHVLQYSCMQDAIVVERIRRKFLAMAPLLDERSRRQWAATEAMELPYGGITSVAVATGLSRMTITTGICELGGSTQVDQKRLPAESDLPGAGRNCLEDTDPGLWIALDALIDPLTRGDPESPLRWTCKSTRRLAEALRGQGHPVSARKVAALLGDMGYSLQANRKTREGGKHPDRNAQFEFINNLTKRLQRRGQPVVSVDTKKKELLGDFKNPGQEWQPEGEPEEVRVHDFKDPELGKAIPYGAH